MQPHVVRRDVFVLHRFRPSGVLEPESRQNLQHDTLYFGSSYNLLYFYIAPLTPIGPPNFFPHPKTHALITSVTMSIKLRPGLLWALASPCRKHFPVGMVLLCAPADAALLPSLSDMILRRSSRICPPKKLSWRLSAMDNS